MRQISSNRKWILVFKQGIKEEITLETIYEKSEQSSDFEYNYALQGKIDTVLDMKVNETIFFQHHRDDENCKALLTRIK